MNSHDDFMNQIIEKSMKDVCSKVFAFLMSNGITDIKRLDLILENFHYSYGKVYIGYLEISFYGYFWKNYCSSENSINASINRIIEDILDYLEEIWYTLL